MAKRKSGGWWQFGKHPDKGCKQSFGYACGDCPYQVFLGYETCLYDYPPKKQNVMKKELDDRLREILGSMMP